MARSQALLIAAFAVSWQQNVFAQDIHFLIKPNPELAAKCLTETGKEDIWQAIPEYSRRDIGFQADALGIPAEQYKQSFLISQCTLARDGLVDGYDQLRGLSGTGEWWCKASWNDKCKDTQVVKAPEGFQICGVTYTTGTDRGDNEFRTEPSGFFPDESNRNRRFRTLAMTIEARGRGAILNRVSAHFRITNLLVTMVPDYWPDAARRKNNCIVPAAVAPPVPRPPMPTGPAPQPVPATVSWSYADGRHSFRFAMANPGTVATTMGYEVYMTDASGERLWGNDTQTIQPGTTWYSDGYHNWNALNWRVKSFMIRP